MMAMIKVIIKALGWTFNYSIKLLKTHIDFSIFIIALYLGVDWFLFQKFVSFIQASKPGIKISLTQSKGFVCLFDFKIRM